MRYRGCEEERVWECEREGVQYEREGVSVRGVEGVGGVKRRAVQSKTWGLSHLLVKVREGLRIRAWHERDDKDEREGGVDTGLEAADPRETTTNDDVRLPG